MSPLPSPNPYAAPTTANRALPGVWQDSSERKTICLCAMGFSVCLFLASLTQDAYYTDDQPMAGFVLLIMGWIGVLDGIPAWLANPLLIVAWPLLLFRGTRYFALGCTAFALALALSFLTYDSMPSNPRRDVISSYGPAYWLWVGSIAAALGGAMCSVWLGRERPAPLTGE